MMIKDQSISAFLDELASGSPTPGGGGAAAIMGAIGAALASMVCNLTLGKKNHEAGDVEMQDALKRANALSAQLADLSQADVDAFSGVMSAYGMAKDSDEEKAARSEAIQAALKVATDVPLAYAKLAREVMDISKLVAEKGNKNAITESGISILVAYAALRSAALNVYINIGDIKDEVFNSDRQKQLEQVLEGSDDLLEAVNSTVKERL